MKRTLLLIVALLVLVAPAAAQGADTCGLPTRLTAGGHGTALQDIQAREPAGDSNPETAVLPAGEIFQTNPSFDPQCINGVLWWPIVSMSSYGWMPETIDGQYVVEPYKFTPEAPVAFTNVPMNPPVITDIQTPLPTVTPAANPTALDASFGGGWDWQTFTGDDWYHSPDPLNIQLPSQYMGDMPSLPVDLSSVYFVKDANLNDAQLALLAQNGFVVVPSDYQQFDTVYRDYDTAWDNDTGKAIYVTTDALLHTLYLVYQNSLMFLETSDFYGDVSSFLQAGYQAAEAQYKEAIGTPLEAAARNAAIYYAVPLMLLAQGEDYYVEGYEQTHIFNEANPAPSRTIRAADPAIIAAAQPLVDAALAAEGRLDVPILDDYQEDFSQYKPRSYYAGSPLLESYFRAMMWLGRITFRAKSLPETQTGLLVLRALQNGGAYESWQHMADTLDFLVGPVDDYGPKDYAPLAETIFGTSISTARLADPDNLFAFTVQVAQLPPPRINSIPIPVGPTTTEELQEQTRGFRLFGQRFTFDGYLMQQLIYPAVGTADMSRTLPLGLDVPEVLGSDTAYALADAAGATDYANYTANASDLRNEVNGLTADNWLENLYGGWLWTLQPLAVREPTLLPPMMQTDAWKHKDLTTFLGSYTELKHATLLYAEQPMGGLGGGGMEPPVISYGHVEENPLVFARIAVVATLLNQGLAERGYIGAQGGSTYAGIDSVGSAARSLASLSSYMAEMARKEVAGEALTHDEAYFLQETFYDALWYIRYDIEQWVTNPPETVALVADVASNAASGEALELGIGNPDLIYAITNSPYGLQLTRGAVYSYYEFTVPIDQRMTDDEWRAQVAAGEVPARPAWIDRYYSK